MMRGASPSSVRHAIALSRPASATFRPCSRAQAIALS
jgi:hypothetical protein